MGNSIVAVRAWEEEGVGAKFDLFSAEERGFESESVTDTRATTDKKDPFFNMGFKHGKWVDKNGAKCSMGFGRVTKNTHQSHSISTHILRTALSEVSLFIVVQIRDQFVRAMRDSDPGVRIVFVH